MATLAREGEEILVTAVLALDAGKAIVEDATIKIAVDHLYHISMEDAVLGGEALIIDLLKLLISSITGLSGTSTRFWLLSAPATGHLSGFLRIT